MAPEQMGDAMTGMMKSVLLRARDFLRNARGNVAMMFGIALVPMAIAAGVGLDYARGAMVRASMNEALDAAALAVGSTPGLTQDKALLLAQKYFDANYKGSDAYGNNPQVTIVSYSTTGTVALKASVKMPTTLLRVIGDPDVDIDANSTVVWGQSKLWVALVLDNSGSMAQGDSGGSKMDALQDALTNTDYGLLTKLKAASSIAGDVQVGIVPFTRSVNMGYSSFVNSSSIDWGEWDAPPRKPGVTTSTAYADNLDITNPDKTSGSTISNIKFSAWGPGDECPFTTTSNGRKSPFGFYCTEDPSNGADTVSTIPSSGTYKGYICPGQDPGTYGNADHRARYYNGCYTSTKDGTNKVTVNDKSSATCGGFSSSNCSCSGSGNSKVCKTQRWVHTWVPNNHNTWGGCVMDRQQKNYQTILATGTGLRTIAIADYDTSNTQPSTVTPDTQFPAENGASCLSATVMPLNYSWTSLSSKVTAMSPNGSTNQAIGMEHGWQMLTPGAPYSTPAVPANTSRYIILFSDGLNTQNRWVGDGSTEGTAEDDMIDARMKTACDGAKADGITVYTLYVHIGNNGSSDALEACATDSSKYYDLTSSSQISTAFAQIAQQITNVRVSK